MGMQSVLGTGIVHGNLVPGGPGQLPVRPWGLEIDCVLMHVCMCVHQQLNLSCGLRDLYVHVPATGKIGIQGQLLSRLNA